MNQVERAEKNIKICWERLNRQYQINKNMYDEIALLDLSHMLRLWIDMKDEVQGYLDDHQINVLFPGYTLAKSFSRFLHGKEYVVTAMPGGIQPPLRGKKPPFSLS